MIHYYYIILLIITGLASSLVTLYIPNIREQRRRNKEFKRQELIDLIERIVEEKIKQILND
jgi:hypothetical protein